MALSDALDDYCKLLRSLGARISDFLAGPASEGELERLGLHLSGEIPKDLVELYQITAGVDYEAYREHMGGIFETHFFLPGMFWSIDQAIYFSEERWRYLVAYDCRRPYRGYPFVGSNSGLSMFVECDSRSSRVVSNSIGDGTENGFYHDTIEDFIVGCHQVLTEGYYQVDDRGHILFVPPEDRMFDFHRLSVFGFRSDQDPDGSNPPPRLPLIEGSGDLHI